MDQQYMYNMIQLYAWDSAVTSLDICTLYNNLEH